LRKRKAPDIQEAGNDYSEALPPPEFNISAHRYYLEYETYNEDTLEMITPKLSHYVSSPSYV